MKNTLVVLTVFVFFIALTEKTYSQKKVTYYYNDKDLGVGSQEECATYKVITLDNQEKPVGEIHKYYKTGELMATAEYAKKIDRFNDKNSIYCGVIKVYYKNGNLQELCRRNDNGILVGEDIQYFESGKTKTEAYFNSEGQISGTVKHYYENGKVSQEFRYRNGKINGTGLYYNENGVKNAEIEFVDGNPKYDWYLAFDANGKSYKYDIKTNEPYAEKNSNTIAYNLSLTKDGKLKNNGDVLADVISYVPAGASVGVYTKDKGYYKVIYNGKVGYINEMYFNKSNKSNSASSKKKFGRKEIKSYYKDGKTFQYYVHNGISVTMHLSIERTYGKYYIAYVSIENLTGKSFNFNPNYIRATFTKKGTNSAGEVLSSNEYMRKVTNRQSWNAALVAFGESSSASQAGYSSSSTTSTTSGYSNTYGSASGYYGNTYGSVSGSSSTYGTATTRSTTQSYDGAANYAAQQNAQRNVANYQNQQYQIKDVLNQGYLKLNTIGNEQRIVGYVNVKYKNADQVKVTIPVNGVNYDFLWNN